MGRDILLGVEAHVDAPTIVDALTTKEGLSSFWTSDSIAEPAVGTEARSGFQGAPVPLRMRVDRIEPNEVTWTCLGDFPFWQGTIVTWSLSPRRGARRDAGAVPTCRLRRRAAGVGVRFDRLHVGRDPREVEGAGRDGERRAVPRVARMAIDVTVRTAIDRARDEVAAYVIDHRNDPVWIGGISESELLGDGPLSEGSRVRRVGSFLGTTIEYVNEIVRLEPGSVLEMRSVKSPFPMRITYAFRGSPAGSIGSGDR
jgi:uncharacterized protein YndB with AHSA1/START domain